MARCEIAMRKDQRDECDQRIMSCRACHCRDLRVVWTYRAVDGTIRRRRQCRHCGLETTTVETMLGDARPGHDRKAT